MTSLPALFRTAALLAFLFSASPLFSQVTYSVGNNTITNYPASGPMFVIDSDHTAGATPPGFAPYNRWFITAQTTVTAVTTGPFSVQLQGRFRLVDQRGTTVPCENADVNGYVPGVFANFSALGAGTSTTTRSAYLVPTVTLDPAEFYKVEATVNDDGRGSVLASSASGWNFRFIHFTGPNAADTKVNAVGYLEAGAGFAHTFAVQTDPANADFFLSVPYTLYRYDDPTLGQQSSNVNLRFNVQLFDSAAPGVPIALQTANTVLPVGINNHAATNHIFPSEVSNFALISCRPAAGVQLHSATTTYFARVTLSHFEDVATLLPDNSSAIAPTHLLHFNGKLIFGRNTSDPIETTFTSITNNPSLGALLSPTSISASLAIAAASVKGTSHTFTANNLPVTLLDNGDCDIRGGGSVSLVPPSVPDRASVGGVRFQRSGIVLNGLGGTAASLITLLPTGMGWATNSTDKTLNPRFDFTALKLNQALQPAASQLDWSPPGGINKGWVMEESKPILLSASTVSWIIASGRFDIVPTNNQSAAYVRGPEFNQLELSPVPSTMKTKCSNEQYWRYAQNMAVSQFVLSGRQGGAEFTGGYSFNNQNQVFCTHSPYRAVMILKAGQMVIHDDAIVSASSSLTLPAATPSISMRWLNGCPDLGCDAPSPSQTTVQGFTPTGLQLKITADGGLVGGGTFVNGLDLKWGHIPSLSLYAHRVVTPFVSGTFAMSGVFLNGANLTPLGANDGPGIILNIGVSAVDGSAMDRPASAAYAAGRGEYPGFNVNLGADLSTTSGVNGQSTLAGSNYGPYALKQRCKYYVRASGVTGIHDKVASAPQALTLYGYSVTLTNFGISVRDNDMIDSRTNGSLRVPPPSNIFVAFNELTFHCNGALKDAKIDAGSNPVPSQKLEYWNAPIDILAMQFVHPDICIPDEGYLTLGLNSYASHIIDTLSGTVGFLANGNLINKAFASAHSLEDLDSRFKLPKQVRFQGPKRQTTQGGFEEYVLTPSADAYLNITGTPPLWNANANDSADGFWNIAGRLKVSFFEAPMAHLQMTANKPVDIVNPSPWQNSIIRMANGAWQTSVLQTTSYFNATSYHDTWNRGFPYPIIAQGIVTGTGESRDDYYSKPDFMCFTQHSWLSGAIHFEYKLKWNSSTRSFTSLEASESQDNGSVAQQLAQQMVVLKIDHRLPYLSAERAEMTFGASYAGMPQISTANIALNEIDDATGVFKAATDAACGPIFEGLDKGINSLSKLLNDQLHDLFTEALNPIVHPLSADIYNQLSTQWGTPNWTPASVVTARLATFRTALKSALHDAQGSLNLFKKIDALLNDTKIGLEFVTNNNDGLLALNDAGDIEVVRNLTKKLIELLSKELGGTTNAVGGLIEDKISSLVDPLIKDAQPTLLDIRNVLLELDIILGDVQKAVAQGGVVVAEIADIIDQADLQLSAITDGANAELLQYFSTFSHAPGGKNFLAVDKAQIILKIENAIYDRFFGSAFVAKIQVAIKQQLQDVEVSIHSGVDSVLGEVNKVIKKALASLLSEVDDQINGVLGSLGKYLGAGQVIGSATFNGDALRKLRMDGKFDFKVPDDVHIEAFLEINQYTSKDTAPGCTQPVGDQSLTEVTIGAINVPTDFISEGTKFDLDVKCSFLSELDDSLKLVGVGGGIKLVQGPIDFEAVKITKLAAAVAFSSDASYFSAGVTVLVQSWGGNGGVFFGRTCTLDPIEMWDPFAAKALGDPGPDGFSGFYVYGEVHIPVSEVLLGIPDSCFFSITADAGIGFYYFSQGPTYGARMGLGVNGEVLCLLSISGRVDLLGGRSGGQTKLTGKGEVCTSLLFIEACKDVTISTSIGSDGRMKGKGGAK